MNDFAVRALTGIVAGALFLGAYFYSWISFTVVLLVALAFMLVVEWPRIARVNWRLWLLTPIYPVAPVFSLIYLNYFYRSIDFLIPLYPFFVCWVADTAGYLAGCMWGKHKICPRISPKKSWEGFWAGVVSVFILNWAFFLSRPHFSFLSGCMLCLPLFSIFITAVALSGDLFESHLKRKASLKDSGSILPGHGGFLDRADSVLFVGVVFLLIKLRG